MAYEKKIEPLSKFDVFAGAFALQCFVIFSNVLPWGLIGMDFDCIELYFKADINVADDMQSVHTCVKDHRTEFLAGFACLLLAYPCIIAVTHYNARVNETILAFVNVSYIESLDAASWLTIAILGGAVIPALGIFIAYYDWELAPGYEYYGYVMQYQMLKLLNIIVDCGHVAQGIAASLPWFYIIFSMFGLFESHHYKITRDDQVKLMGMFANLEACGRGCGRFGIAIFALFIIMFCMFGSLGNTLDFGASGFFSYSGGSQALYWLIFISYELQIIQKIILGCKLEQRTEFLLNSVQEL